MTSRIERIVHGDALEELKTLENNSVDSVVTDPPYGLSKEPDINEVLTKWLAGEEYDHGYGGFMGKSWDSFVPHPDLWGEVFRVLKPGGHALVFAGTRTQDLMTISLRLVGFEVRDVIEWLYFSGFPKGHDVGKAFDRREETELARKWDGWGTSLKPAHEPIIVVRKPLVDADTGRKLTVADCVDKYGTGAINVDASRIEMSEEDYEEYKRKTLSFAGASKDNGGNGKTMDGGKMKMFDDITNHLNERRRFPANCITVEQDEFYSKYFNVSPGELSKKASKRDRNSDWQGEEIDGLNVHPTVKPTELMAWLVRLVTPEGGTVLDPFAGSGSTLVAAKREEFGFIGIEREADYIEIIEARTGNKVKVV